MTARSETCAEVVRTWVEAQDARDYDRMVRCMAADAVHEDMTMGVRKEGRPEIEAFARDLEEHLSSDYRIRLVDLLAGEDGYAAEWEISGTNDRADDRYGMPATGRGFTMRGVSVGRVRDGLIVANRDYWDLAGYLGQVGLLPQSAAAAGA